MCIRDRGYRGRIETWGKKWNYEIREFNISLRKKRGSSAAFAYNLSLGLVRETPKVILRKEFCTVSSETRTDLFADIDQ